MPHALLVENDVATRDALAAVLATEGFSTSLAQNLSEGFVQIGRQHPDVVLVGLELPDGSGLDLARQLGTSSGIEMIVMASRASVDSVVDALRLGVADYLVKPIDTQRLKTILARVPRTQDLRAEITGLRATLLAFGRFGSTLGRSPSMLRVYDAVALAAKAEAPVFLLGETGTGKQHTAQTLHALSLRRKRAFVAVACGAIAPSLMDAELFGRERTQHGEQRRGLFERASGGTLFLGEITEVPLDLQRKLLRVLDTGMLQRVGASRETPADVRLVASTRRDPREEVARGRLHEALFHRLNVAPILLPPLREREADPQLIAQHFLDELNGESRARKFFAPEVLLQMLDYEWPGNVRELKSYVHRSFLMTEGLVIDSTIHSMALGARAPLAESVTIPIGMSLAEADRRLIFATLKHVGGVKKRAAEVLGISSKTLYNRLIEYGSAEMGDGAVNGDDDVATAA